MAFELLLNELKGVSSLHNLSKGVILGFMIPDGAFLIRGSS
jgi:hypothetical protein